jgi:hypothetical protein
MTKRHSEEWREKLEESRYKPAVITNHKKRKTQQVTIVLDEQLNTKHSGMLTKKFSLQEKGVLKWIREKENYLSAVKNCNGDMIAPMPVELLVDKNFVVEALSTLKSRYVRRSIENVWGMDEEVKTAILMHCGVKYIHALQMSNISVENAIVVLKRDPSAISRLPMRLKRDERVILESMDVNLSVMCYDEWSKPESYSVILPTRRLVQQLFRLECREAAKSSFEPIPPNIRNRVRKRFFEYAKREGIICGIVDPYLVRRDHHALGVLLEHPSDDFEMMRYMVIVNYKTLEYASHRIRNSKIIAMAIAAEHAHALGSVISHFSDDRDVVLCAVSKNGLSLEFVSDRLKRDMEVATKAVENKGRSFMYVHDELKKNEELFLLALKNDPTIFSTIPHCFKKNKNIVLSAIKLSEKTPLQDIPDELYNDREVAMAIVSNNGCDIGVLNENLRNDKEIVLMAINSDARSMDQLGEVMRNDKDVILSAIKNKRSCFYRLSPSIQRDLDIVLLMMSTHGENMEDYIPPEIYRCDTKESRAFMIKALVMDSTLLRFIPHKALDTDIMLTVTKQRPEAVLEMKPSSLKNKSVMLEAIRRNSRMFLVVDESLREDEDIVLEMLSHNSGDVEFVPPKLRWDRNFLVKAISRNHRIQWDIRYMLEDDVEMALVSVKSDPSAYARLTSTMRGNKDIVLEASKHKNGALMYTPDILMLGEEIILKILIQDPISFVWLPTPLRDDITFNIKLLKAGFVAKPPWKIPGKRTEEEMLQLIVLSPFVACSIGYSRVDILMRAYNNKMEECYHGCYTPSAKLLNLDGY